MGNQSEASNYSYSLEVGPTGHKQTFKGIPQSIRDWHMEARDTFDGLIIYRKMALSYLGEDNKEFKLRITGKIWENQENNSNDDDDDDDGVSEPNMGSGSKNKWNLKQEHDIPIPSDEQIVEPKPVLGYLNENLLHLAGIYKHGTSGNWVWREEYEQLMAAEKAAAALRKVSNGSGRGGTAPMDSDSQPSTFDADGSSTQPRVESGWVVMKREILDHIDSRFDTFQTAYRADLAEARRQEREDLNAGFENF
ncbi:hypothetical protein RIF29_26299 [Crotalaria pallida]|uniref:Seven-in-absentia protein TRAF-like domain-containing protein n=1 Tax=Crotalaria pallida TaxID=3830 RepID=A0AAN9HY08_CROPI